MANPWGPPERAAAREDAILAQYMAAVTEAKRRFDPKHQAKQFDRWLHARFGSAGVYIAIINAANRRIVLNLQRRA